MKELVFNVHKDVYPDTDHGHTWVQVGWYTMDGQRIGPTFPVAGCCERLGDLPGGPILYDAAAEEAQARRSAGGYVEAIRTERTERINPGKWYVYSTCITQTPL